MLFAGGRVKGGLAEMSLMPMLRLSGSAEQGPFQVGPNIQWGGGERLAKCICSFSYQTKEENSSNGQGATFITVGNYKAFRRGGSGSGANEYWFKRLTGLGWNLGWDWDLIFNDLHFFEIFSEPKRNMWVFEGKKMEIPVHILSNILFCYFHGVINRVEASEQPLLVMICIGWKSKEKKIFRGRYETTVPSSASGNTIQWYFPQQLGAKTKLFDYNSSIINVRL